MRQTKKTYQDFANWCVSKIQDAILFRWTSTQLRANTSRDIWDNPQYKRLPQYQREYVRGYSDCFRESILMRTHIESGSFVTMPDKTVQFFGNDLLGNSHKMSALLGDGCWRYVHDNEVPGTGGLYWYGTNGTKPYSVTPAHDFCGLDDKRCDWYGYCGRAKSDPIHNAS